MPLPSLELSYEFDSNRYRSNSNEWTERRYLLLDFVTVMTSWSTNPWTMVASSNGSTAGWPGPGWSSISDIVRAYGSTPHSWMVLENPVGGGQICIDVEGVNDQLGGIFVSFPGNFTGGTVNDAPISGATYLRCTYRDYWFNNASWTDYRAHFVHATNGEQDYYCITNADYCQWYFFFGKAGNPDSGWSHPWFCSVAASAGANYRVPRIYGSYSDGWAQPVGGEGVAAFAAIQSINPVNNHAWLRLCAEGNEENFVCARNNCAPNVISGEQSMFPLNIYGFSAGDYGVHGRLRDVYLIQRFGVSDAVGDCDTLEIDTANPAYEWACFGDFAFPNEPGVQPLM